MIFFFKKPTIHLDAFTARKDVIEYAPVVNGIEKIPAWWKELPKSYVRKNSFFPIPTMKGCVGLSSYYSKSIAMPMWSDLSVNVLENGAYQWQFSDSISTADVHDEEQFTGLGISGYGHIKLVSPWRFKTKQDLNWVSTCPIYNLHNNNDFIFAQGLLNFKHQATTNVQMFLNTQNPRTFLIPFNTVFMFTPMSESNVVIHRHLISNDEYNLISQTSMLNTFVGKYNLHNRLPQCPYKDKTK